MGGGIEKGITTFTAGSWWALPEQDTTGSGSTTLTDSASYNFNNSATTSRTDPNGLTTTYTENSWLEPTQVNPPGGASFGLGYGDWGDFSSQSVSYSEGGVNKSFSSSLTNQGRLG